MKSIYIMLLFIFLCCNNVFSEEPPPTNDVSGYICSNEKVMGIYKDRSEFISNSEEMGRENFNLFCKNLRSTQTTPLLAPNRRITAKIPLKNTNNSPITINEVTAKPMP